MDHIWEKINRKCSQSRMLLCSPQLCSVAIKNALFFFSKTFFSCLFIFQCCELWSHRVLHGAWTSSCILWLWWVPAVMSLFTLLGPHWYFPLRGSYILVPVSMYTCIIKVDEAKENPFQAMLTTKKTQRLMWGIKVNARNTFTFYDFFFPPQCCLGDALHATGVHYRIL